MPKVPTKKNPTSKKPVNAKTSPNSKLPCSQKTLQEIYSSKSSEITFKKLLLSKKTPVKKLSNKTQRCESKKAKHSKTKTVLTGFALVSSTSEREKHKKCSDRTRAPSTLEQHSKKVQKCSNKPPFHKARSPTSYEMMATLKSSRAKIFDLVKTRLKSSKQRSVSSRRSSKDVKKSVKSNRSNSLGRPFSNMDHVNDEKFEKISFQHPVTCRENYEDLEFNYKNLEPCKTHKINKKTISLMDTEEFGDFQEYEKLSKDFQKNTKKLFTLTSEEAESFQSSQTGPSIKKNSEKILENFRRNRAARKIKSSFRKYLENHRKTSTSKLQELLKEQISWKEAQILTLEYLKQKELEDLQFLSGVLGRNSQLEELLLKSVQDRFDNFSKFFKNNLEGIEQRYKETVQTEEISELSLKVKDKKDVVSRIIQETNLSSSASKMQMESLVREPAGRNDESNKFLKPGNSITVNDFEHIDPTMLSPILPEIINFPDLSSLIIEEEKTEGQGVPEPYKIDDFTLESLISAYPVPLLKLQEIKETRQDLLTSEKRIETSSDFVFDYLKSIFLKNQSKIALKVKNPVIQDPLEQLEKIHNDFNDFEDRFIFQPVLDIEKILITSPPSAEASSSSRQLQEADLIHKKMLLAASDEVLQFFRPYNVKGLPQVWSYQDRVLVKKPLIIEDLLSVFLNFMTGLSMCQVGKIPTENMILSNGHLDEAALNAARNEALEFTLKKDIIDYEWLWNDFEFEETQVKLDMADILLADLAEELSLILN
jgi:hypothetical protein